MTPGAEAWLGALAVVFVALAARRAASGRPDVGHQARTWALVGVIFGAVSAWLFLRGR